MRVCVCSIYWKPQRFLFLLMAADDIPSALRISLFFDWKDMLNAFYIFVYALAVPVYSVLDYFCRNACNDHVRFVESFGHNASPAYDAVVGNAYVFADFDIFAYPYVASYFDAFSVVDGMPSRFVIVCASVHHMSTPQLNWLSSPMLTCDPSS